LKKPSEKESLKKEIVIHRQLDHANVVTLFEVFESEIQVCFVIELVEGGSLFDFLTAPESTDHALLPLARRLKVHRDETRVQVLFWQMLSAVDYLHKCMLVHRDIKLENFLVSKDGRTLKLCDFGLSAPYTPDSLTKSSCGSPLYVSPEVLLGISYDPTKSDLWSLGVTLFAVLFRKMPFLDEKNQLVLDYTLRGVRNLPENLIRRITPEAHEVLCMLLEPDPTKRASVKELCSHPWVQTGKAMHEMEMGLDSSSSRLTRPAVPKRRRSFLFLKNSVGVPAPQHTTAAHVVAERRQPIQCQQEERERESEAVNGGKQQTSFLKSILGRRKSIPSI
jgi:serine/threonine protein kinase